MRLLHTSWARRRDVSRLNGDQLEVHCFPIKIINTQTESFCTRGSICGASKRAPFCRAPGDCRVRPGVPWRRGQKEVAVFLRRGSTRLSDASPRRRPCGGIYGTLWFRFSQRFTSVMRSHSYIYAGVIDWLFCKEIVTFSQSTKEYKRIHEIE